MFALILGVCAFLLGVAAGVLLERLIAAEHRLLELAPPSPVWQRWRPVLVGLAIAGFAVAIQHAELTLRCLETPEVQPPEHAEYLRVIYHTILAGLLVLATVIDLDCYLIPDRITVPGTLCGLAGAVLGRDLQIAHLWVDWSQAIPQLQGPFIPDWYHHHPMLHGLAWSLSGLFGGATLTLLVRSLASRILGQEGMGFGDVTLMAMIGSFLGWQAVVLTFALAPLTGLLIGLVGKLLFNRPYLPYGPYLSAAALVVLVSWRWLWAETRLMFSDLVGLTMLAGIGAVALTLLLGLLRLYRSIPTGR